MKQETREAGLKATAVRRPLFVYVCLKSGSQLACQAPGALPYIDGGRGQGTSGPYCTTTRCLPWRDFAQFKVNEPAATNKQRDFNFVKQAFIGSPSNQPELVSAGENRLSWLTPDLKYEQSKPTQELFHPSLQTNSSIHRDRGMPQASKWRTDMSQQTFQEGWNDNKNTCQCGPAHMQIFAHKVKFWPIHLSFAECLRQGYLGFASVDTAETVLFGHGLTLRWVTGEPTWQCRSWCNLNAWHGNGQVGSAKRGAKPQWGRVSTETVHIKIKNACNATSRDGGNLTRDPCSIESQNRFRPVSKPWRLTIVIVVRQVRVRQAWTWKFACVWTWTRINSFVSSFWQFLQTGHSHWLVRVKLRVRGIAHSFDR